MTSTGRPGSFSERARSVRFWVASFSVLSAQCSVLSAQCSVLRATARPPHAWKAPGRTARDLMTSAATAKCAPKDPDPAKAFPGGEIYLSMPGLGDRLAARVAGEIGKHIKQLRASRLPCQPRSRHRCEVRYRGTPRSLIASASASSARTWAPYRRRARCGATPEPAGLAGHGRARRAAVVLINTLLLQRVLAEARPWRYGTVSAGHRQVPPTGFEPALTAPEPVGRRC